MNTIYKIFSSPTMSLKAAVRLLRKNKVNEDRLRRCASGLCMFSKNSKLLREASKGALEKIEVARKKKAAVAKVKADQERIVAEVKAVKERVKNRAEIKRLQASLGVDGGVHVAAAV